MPAEDLDRLIESGPGFSEAEAARLPAQYRVPGIVIKAGKSAA